MWFVCCWDFRRGEALSESRNSFYSDTPQLENNLSMSSSPHSMKRGKSFSEASEGVVQRRGRRKRLSGSPENSWDVFFI